MARERPRHMLSLQGQAARPSASPARVACLPAEACGVRAQRCHSRGSSSRRRQGLTLLWRVSGCRVLSHTPLRWSSKQTCAVGCVTHPSEVRTWDAEPSNSLDLASSVLVPKAGALLPAPSVAGGQPRSLEGALWKVRNELKALRRPPGGPSVLPTTQP